MIDVKLERRLDYDDDLVVVKTPSGKVDYKGESDYNPYKDEDWRYDSKNDIYTLPNGYTMKVLESRQIKKEAYERKDKYVIDDIITVAKSSSLDNIELKSINPEFAFKKITATGDAAKIEAIKTLIDWYVNFRDYENSNEDKYNKASVVMDNVLEVIDNNFDGRVYVENDDRVIFHSDMDLDDVLDIFEDNMDIKTHGTMRGGSWTSIDYVTNDRVELQIGRNNDEHYNYVVLVHGL